MRELGKEGLAVARPWLEKQTAVSHIIVKMHTCGPTTDRESLWAHLAREVRCFQGIPGGQQVESP